jgi:uncharacterized protein
LYKISAMQIKRSILDPIMKRLVSNETGNKAIVIYGARQVGKTTLSKEILSSISLKSEYFNCDYLDVQSLFSYKNAGNLENVVRNLDLLVLDEAQRIREIGMVLKILHDTFPRLKIIATGSSSFDLSNKINEPLTGRKAVFQLYPFSYTELDSTRTPLNAGRLLPRILRWGMYPAVILNDDNQASENLKEIATSYLFKDLFEFQTVKNPEAVLNLLKLLAFQIGSEVSYTELSQKLMIDQTVVQRYIHLLESSFIIFRLPALKRNSRNEIGKSRKIYFWDLGIRNMLVQQINTLDFRNDQDALWENFCVAEHLKYMNNHSEVLFNSYFWRTYNQKEIDYVEEIDGLFKAFEFAWSSGRRKKIPKEFLDSYPHSEIKIVTRENFLSELF